jgi:HD-GYP domain-containing protein (c-di-GMP phosphodiesterase class II)
MDQPQGLDDLVTLLSQGLTQRSMYFESHPRVQQHARDFAARIQTLLQADRREYFFLGFVEGNLVHEGRFLIGPTILGRRVVDLMAALDCGGILFKAGLSAEEVLVLFEIAADMRTRALDLGAARSALQQRQAVHLQLSPPYSDPGWFGQFLFEGSELIADGGLDAGVTRMLPVYQRMFDSVENAHSLASRDSDLDINSVRGVGEKLLEAADGNFTDVMQLVRYPDYDTFTVGHSVRVASIAVLVGHGAGMPRELQIELAAAGMLHDVGKSKIPDEILYKADGLEDDERRLVERHPLLGAQILLENREATRMQIAAAFGHHLRYAGGGYPALPNCGVSSRMTALLKVCDVFEALTAVRPYKTAMSARAAYEIMLRDRGSFEPGAFHALVRAIGLYPPGSRVLLSSGELGVVVKAGVKIDRPLIRISHDPAGKPVEEGRMCDLAELDKLRVVRSLPDRPVRTREQAAPGATALCTHAEPDAATEATRRQIEKRRR